MKQRLAKAALKRQPGLNTESRESWDSCNVGAMGTSWSEEVDSRIGVGETSSFMGIEEWRDIVGQGRWVWTNGRKDVKKAFR
jgi:hypothetical protein